MIPSRISTRRGFASGLLGVAAISLLPMGALAAPPTSDGGVTLEPLGTFDGGGLAHAEIVAYDATSERICPIPAENGGGTMTKDGCHPATTS